MAVQSVATSGKGTVKRVGDTETERVIIIIIPKNSALVGNVTLGLFGSYGAVWGHMCCTCDACAWAEEVGQSDNAYKGSLKPARHEGGDPRSRGGEGGGQKLWDPFLFLQRFPRLAKPLSSFSAFCAYGQACITYADGGGW